MKIYNIYLQNNAKKGLTEWKNYDKILNCIIIALLCEIFGFFKKII